MPWYRSVQRSDHYFRCSCGGATFTLWADVTAADLAEFVKLRCADCKAEVELQHALDNHEWKT
jgi:hypothetical protein